MVAEFDGLLTPVAILPPVLETLGALASAWASNQDEVGRRPRRTRGDQELLVRKRIDRWKARVVKVQRTTVRKKSLPRGIYAPALETMDFWKFVKACEIKGMSLGSRTEEHILESYGLLVQLS